MLRKRLVLALTTVLVAAAVQAQTVKARVDGGAIHGHVAALAAPDLQGRRTLTPGFDRAADWAATRFEEWGLTPAGDAGTFVQAVSIAGPRSDFAWTTGMPEFVVGGNAFSFRDGEFLLDQSSTAATDITAEAVFVGYGISAPEKGLDEYGGVEVAGRIAFVLRGSPRDAPPDLTDFPPDPPPAAGPPDAWADESSDAAKIATAFRKGAAAIVLCEADPATRRVTPWPRARPQASPFSRPFVVVASRDARVLRAVMLRDPQETLVGFVDRMNRLRRAVQQKHPRSEATGVRVRVKGYDEVTLYGESFGKNQSRNVLAKVEGSDPSMKRQAVVIGAHLDHLGYRSGVIHPGADDNASGSAVVLEVARTFVEAGLRPRRTVIFALWCGEENGHHGSRRFTESPPDGMAMDRVVAYINMDMVGLGTTIDANGAKDFPAVFAVMMKDMLPEIAGLVRPEVSGPGGSDYASFLAHGVDSVALLTSGGNGHPDYHDSSDVPARVQPALLGAVGQFVLQAAANLADETATPLPVPGRREACASLRFVAPDLGGQAPDGWRTVAPGTAVELESAIVAAARQFGRDEATTADASAEDQPPHIFVGARSASVAGNLPVLEGAAEVLGVGRLDVNGDDGVWVKDGLTAEGKAALKAMEQRGITLNLVRPSARLAADALATSSKPMLVSGMSSPDVALARRVAERHGVFALQCRVGESAVCAESLQTMRASLGGSANLLVSFHASAGDGVRASRALYHALRAKGWEKDEIYAIAGMTPDGDPGGNLSRFAAK